MTPQSPTATTQALFEALRNRDWAGAVALADPDALAAWHRSERASLANLLLAPGPPDLEADDMAAVEELLREHANAKVRLANIGTLQALTSLSPAAYLVRLWEILDQLFGSRPEDERTPSFQIVGEDRHSDDRVYVRYRGYLGVGGGMPETLEFRRRGDSWRWVITPELATPNFAVLIGAQGGPR